MSDHIPFEIQVEIIKKLLIKSLIQFRSVSKAWKSVIESSDFIADYTLHNPTQQQHLLIRYDNLYSEETYVSIVEDDSFPKNKFSPTVPRSVDLLWDSFVVGTSHGLVCLFGYYRYEGGEFKEIYLPNTLAFHDPMYLYLFKLSDYLAVLQDWIMDDVYEVWMMYDNGDSKSLTNLFTINVPDISSFPLEFTRNGELMMRLTDDTDALIVYNPFSKHVNDLGIEGQCYSSLVSSYTESLILLDQKDTIVDDEDDE